MFWRILILALLPFTQSLQAGWSDGLYTLFSKEEMGKAPTIRVLILHDAEKAQVGVRGVYSLYNPHTNAHVSTRFAGKMRTLEPISSGLKWGEEFPGVYQLRLKPDDPITMMMVDGQEYVGSLLLYDIGGSISIVNQVPVDEYTVSILASRELPTLHPETLAALSIVTRTNAYFQVANPKTNFWAVDASKVGFEGFIPEKEHEAIETAVLNTRNMIMSQTGVYEGIATPFAAQFGPVNPGSGVKETVASKLSLEEADALAQKGAHAAQILAKAFPGITIMLTQPVKH